MIVRKSSEEVISIFSDKEELRLAMQSSWQSRQWTRPVKNPHSIGSTSLLIAKEEMRYNDTLDQSRAFGLEEVKRYFSDEVCEITNKQKSVSKVNSVIRWKTL